MASLRSPLYTATACEVTVAHLEMRCLSAAGVGSRHVWSVSVGGQVSSVCDDSSVAAVTSGYGSPWIAEVAVLATADSPAGFLQTEGGSVVVLRGGNFGPPGASSCVVNGFLPLQSLAANHSTIVVQVPAGTVQGVELIVQVADQQAFHRMTVAFDSPRISSISVRKGKLRWQWGLLRPELIVSYMAHSCTLMIQRTLPYCTTYHFPPCFHAAS